MRGMGIRPSRESAIYLGIGLVIGFLVLWPRFWLFLTSFLTEAGELTLKHWSQALKAPFLWEAFWNTIFVSTVSTGVAIVVGVGLAFIVARTDTPGRRYFEFIALLTFVTPGIISGIAWTVIANKESGLVNIILERAGLDLRVNIFSMGGLIFLTALFTIPFIFYTTLGGMRQINSELEDSSSICGASKCTTFLRVTVPLLLPAITGGGLLAFMESNQLFGIHLVIGMPANIWVLDTAIYASLGFLPASIERAAIQGLILLAISAVALWIQWSVMGKSRKYVTITGKGFRAREVKIGKWRWFTFGICSLYATLMIILPYLVIFFRSLKRHSFQPNMTLASLFQGWEFGEYARAIFYDIVSRRALINSTFLSIGAGVVAMTLSGIAAYMITKTTVHGRKALGFICMIPMATPGVVTGVASLIGYNIFPFCLYGTLWILLLSYITMSLTVGLKAAEGSFMQIDKELDDSARICGASWLHQFRTVTLPLVRPGMITGFILIFTYIIRETGASIILFSLGTEVSASFIINQWEEGRWQSMSAFIIIVSLIVTTIVAIFLRVTRVRLFSK